MQTKKAPCRETEGLNNKAIISQIDRVNKAIIKHDFIFILKVFCGLIILNSIIIAALLIAEVLK